MTRFLTALCITALLGGCVVVPADYGYRDHGYRDGGYRDGGYRHGHHWRDHQRSWRY